MLNTRQPTGKNPWPLVLVDSKPKGGGFQAALEVAASDRVGRVFVFQVGERSADTYADIGPFEIVELDGSWQSFITQLRAATAEPSDPSRPNVIIVNTITAVWTELKLWAQRRAHNSKAARAILRSDPDAHIDVSMNYWNDAKSRWGGMFHVLRGWQGVTLLVAYGDEVTPFDNGQPVAGETVYRVDAEKGTLAQVTDNISFASGEPAVVASDAATVRAALRNGPMTLPAENPVAHYLFSVINTTEAAVQPSVGVTPGVPASVAKDRVLAVFAKRFGETDAKAAAKALWERHFPGAKRGDIVELNDDLVARMETEAATGVNQTEQAEAQPASGPQADPDPVAVEPDGESEQPQADPTADPEVTDATAVAPDGADADDVPSAEPVEAPPARRRIEGAATTPEEVAARLAEVQKAQAKSRRTKA